MGMAELILKALNNRLVALGAGTLTAAAVGYMLGRYSNNGVPLITKSHSSDDPIMKYIKDHSLRLEPAQEKLIEITKQHSWGIMLGDTIELQLLQLLCKMLNAKKTLDIGVYTGYSAMSIALTLPEDGKVVACDVSTEYADIGRPYWREAGVEHKIDLRIAPAAETLQKLIDAGESGTFDFAFIDADKEGYLTYYELCLKLLRKGGIVAFDNTLQWGCVAVPKDTKPNVLAIRKVNEFLAQDSRIDISFLALGDGTTLCRVK